jgi:NADPH:quinone reductase-like Zn-dependent oxidoreductase
MTTTMRAAQISRPGGAWELVERMAPEPRAGHVRVQVEACGICHSDALVKDRLWPGLAHPRVPGHEITGRIDAAGLDRQGKPVAKNGRVEQNNFHNYRILRINEAPIVQVYIVQSAESPGGVGEPGTAAVAPAITNAIFAATGKRLRRPPIDPARLRST